MKSIRVERNNNVGNIVLANSSYNRLDVRFASYLEEAVHEANENDIRIPVLRAEGPNLSLGGEVREWPGKDANWFCTFVAKVNSSYRAIEALRIPTVAIMQGAAFGGGFGLALSCDSIVTADDPIFRCVGSRQLCCLSRVLFNASLSALGAVARRVFLC